MNLRWLAYFAVVILSGSLVVGSRQVNAQLYEKCLRYGRVGYGYGCREYAPLIFNGYRVDATFWEWDGRNPPERVAYRQAATLYCRAITGRANARVAPGYGGLQIQKGSEQGTWRFSLKGGSGSYCSFCRWYLVSVYCS